MTDPHMPLAQDGGQDRPDAGPERRLGIERRRDRNPQPPPGQGERRTGVRRKTDRVSLEGTGLGAGGRVHSRVRIELPVICRPLAPGSAPERPAWRGMTRTLAPGGVGLLLEEELPVGSLLELLFRLEGDLLAADAEVVSLVPQGGKFLHNCRFTRLGTADRAWLTEYLRLRDLPSA